MRGVPMYGRRLIVASALVLITSTGNGFAAIKDRAAAPSIVERAQAWLAKRVPQVISTFGGKLVIPGG